MKQPQPRGAVWCGCVTKGIPLKPASIGLALALLVVAPGLAGCPEPFETGESGLCSAQTTTSSAAIRACYPLGNDGERITGRLRQFWATDPDLLCSYEANQGFYSQCAVLPANNAMYCSIDDSIAYDASFLNAMYLERGPFAPAVFLAHEWGHLNQARTGLIGPSNKANELQADCFAGVFTAAEEQLGQILAEDVAVAFMAFCSWGDLYASDWFEPGAHGTCAERVGAYMSGYDIARSCGDVLCADPLAVGVAICTRGSCI